MMTSSNPNIQKVTRADSDSLFEIYRAVEAASPYPIGPHWTREQFGQECEELGWVLRDPVNAAGQIVAFVLYRDAFDAFEITLLATAVTALRRGLMAQLLSAWLTDPNLAKPVWLEVHEANRPARNLYEKLGFKEVGKRPRYYADQAACVLYNYG